MLSLTRNPRPTDSPLPGEEVNGKPTDEIVSVLRELIAIVKVRVSAAALMNANSASSLQEASISAHFMLATAETELIDAVGGRTH